MPCALGEKQEGRGHWRPLRFFKCTSPRRHRCSWHSHAHGHRQQKRDIKEPCCHDARANGVARMRRTLCWCVRVARLRPARLCLAVRRPAAACAARPIPRPDRGARVRSRDYQLYTRPATARRSALAAPRRHSAQRRCVVGRLRAARDPLTAASLFRLGSCLAGPRPCLSVCQSVCFPCANTAERARSNAVAVKHVIASSAIDRGGPGLGPAATPKRRGKAQPPQPRAPERARRKRHPSAFERGHRARR
jgi:hypothetical protein